MGTFRHHLIDAPHFGQCDGGDTIDSPRGMRHMTTFRNDATQAPSQKLKNPYITISSFSKTPPFLYAPYYTKKVRLCRTDTSAE